MYFNFLEYSVEFNPEAWCFSVLSGKLFVEEAQIKAETLEHQKLSCKDYPTFRDKQKLELDSLCWRRIYGGGPAATPELFIGFRLRADSVQFFCDGHARVTVQGILRWGAEPEKATFALRLDSQTPVLRTASGPAAFPGDNALFDRLTDRLLVCSTAGSLRLHYD